MKHKFTLVNLFGGIFRKQGFDTVECESIDMVCFENKYIKGAIGFNSANKRHFIRWRCKDGVELFDVPIANGATSCDFKNVSDLMNFLQRRLVWKKQR